MTDRHEPSFPNAQDIDRSVGWKLSKWGLWLVVAGLCGVALLLAPEPRTQTGAQETTAIQPSPLTDEEPDDEPGDPDEPSFTRQRHEMVEHQIRGRGLTDPRLLAALKIVPRHRFVPEASRDRSYGDHPLPIGYGQTISQPYVVALMSALLDLQPGDRVLEIGTGSAYHAAVLGQLASEVYTIEIVEPLAERSRRLVKELGYDNIHVRNGDGYQGWPDGAPFDAILLTAAPPEIPGPLMEQLAMGGRLVAPVGDTYQRLQVITRTPDGYSTETGAAVRFVPMTGRAQGERSPAPVPASIPPGDLPHLPN